MEISSLEKQIRESFSTMFEENKRIEEVFKRMRGGYATYEDAQTFAMTIGDILRDSFNELDIEGANVEELCEVIVSNAMTQNYNLSSMVCSVVQESLNEAAEVGLNPIQPRLNISKIDGLQTILEEAEDIVGVQNEVATAMSTFTQSVVDDWVKSNADFQARAGLNPVIVRKYEGMHFDPHRTPHWRDCPYCKNLEGIYNYREEPRDVYKRHIDCRCIVSYYPDEKSKGRITALAKGQLDTEQVLWNTGMKTSNSKKAIASRRRREYAREEARKIMSAEWKANNTTEISFT